MAPNAAASLANRDGASLSASGPSSRKQLGANGPNSKARCRRGQFSRRGSTPAALAKVKATKFIRVFWDIPRRLRYEAIDNRWFVSLAAGTAPPHVYAIQRA
jgi:hypothetical protein